VEDGVEVNWKFKATVGTRPIRIMGIYEDRLPLGVTINVKNGEWVISGKALRSRLSEGNLSVRVFDEDACKQSIKNGLSFTDTLLARWNFKVRGQNSYCDYQLHQNNSLFATSASFVWYSSQYVTPPLQPMRPIIEGLASNSLRTPEKIAKSLDRQSSPRTLNQAKLYAIPPLEAPHQGLSFLDECFASGYGHCGLNSDCAWHAGSCASISKNNLKLVGK
jgi:hypothetical protein